MNIDSDTIFNVEKMLKKRKYYSIVFHEKDFEFPYFFSKYINKENLEEKNITIFLKIFPKKITTTLFQKIFQFMKINHIIFIHDTVLSPDVKYIFSLPSEKRKFFIFEHFSLEDFQYDLFSIMFSKVNFQVLPKENCFKKQKISKILKSDPLVKYLGLDHDDVIFGNFSYNDEIDVRRVSH
jgi:hypothetical protein